MQCWDILKSNQVLYIQLWFTCSQKDIPIKSSTADGMQYCCLGNEWLCVDRQTADRLGKKLLFLSRYSSYCWFTRSLYDWFTQWWTQQYLLETWPEGETIKKLLKEKKWKLILWETTWRSVCLTSHGVSEWGELGVVQDAALAWKIKPTWHQ